MTDAVAGGWTKGPCKASRARKSSNFGNWTAFVQCETGTIAKVMGGPTDNRIVAEANAALIAEAFNVATETGLSPSQLAEQRERLKFQWTAMKDEVKLCHQRIGQLRDILLRCIPALERTHAMTPGGPKKSAVLGLLTEVRTLSKTEV